MIIKTTLFATIQNLSVHLHTLIREDQPLSKEELSILLMMRAILIKAGLKETGLMTLLMVLISRSQSSKDSDGSESPHFRVPELNSSQTYPNYNSVDTSLTRFLVALGDVRTQRLQRQRKTPGSAKALATEIEIN